MPSEHKTHDDEGLEKATSLIGKTVYYRPPDEREMKQATVMSMAHLENIRGDKIATLTLDNGDKVGPFEVYFESSIASAK